jgi:hypothetical protein
MKISVGDMVTLKPMKVVSVSEMGHVYVNINKPFERGAWFDESMISSVQPAPLKVGDWVFWRLSATGADTYKGKILATDGEFSWVSCETFFGPQTVKLTDLTRIGDT